MFFNLKQEIYGKTNEIQSAAKLLNKEEGSETISQESTLEIISGSATPSTGKAGGDDIVQKRNGDKFINKATKLFKEDIYKFIKKIF